MKEIIKNALQRHKKSLDYLINNYQLIEKIATLFISTLENKGKIIFIGNGGSAADAQHLAAELVGRFKSERRPLPALALSTNTSILTAIGNDYGFENIFSRQIEGLAQSNDCLVGISTSGNSENIIRAVQHAKEIGIKTVGFLGKNGGKLASCVEIAFIVPVDDTANIQEIHILAGHIICEIVEEYFC